MTPFALRRDNWNDFNFQTLYQLYRIAEKSDPELIGDVKILHRRQSANDPHQVEIGAFDVLGKEYCSVGQSLDYYERLAALPQKIRNRLLKALRDIVLNPAIRDSFRDEEGWRTSVFRDISEDDDFLLDSEMLLKRNFSALPAKSLEISFTVAGWQDPLDLSFDAPAVDSDFILFFLKRKISAIKSRLPSRIAVIIGRNGSGKSTLLARFARVAHGSPSDRETKSLKSLGMLDPPGLGFSRLITISYSAFDSFEVPGVRRLDREQIAKDINEGAGRYVFCGLRDIAAELLEELDDESPDDDTSNDPLPDRRANTRLKPLDDLASEFERLIAHIEASGDWGIFEESMIPLLSEPSFSGLESQSARSLISDDPKNAFMSWSTGHKIALHVVASMCAHARRKSIVLFDEPEAHLHPPMLAALMHSVRVVLDKLDAFGIVATHSPVVLQESLARHVRIIRREGDTTVINTPELETFGENVGALAYEAFQLTAESTDFHSVLDSLAERLGSLEEIEALFDRGLSKQARAYLMSKQLDGTTENE